MSENLMNETPMSDLAFSYDMVRRIPLSFITEELQDWDVDQRLYALAVEGGAVALRALYLYIIAESDWHDSKTH